MSLIPVITLMWNEKNVYRYLFFNNNHEGYLSNQQWFVYFNVLKISA